MLRQAHSDPAPDAIVGDWLSELTVGWDAKRRYEDREKGFQGAEDDYFLKNVLESFELAVDVIAKRKQKLITNAGSLSPKGCAQAMEKIAKNHGHTLRVAYVTGDDIMDRYEELDREKALTSFDTGEPLRTLATGTWCGLNAYIGAWSIVEALQRGADIVVTGRSTDASSVMALAAWHHHWDHSQYDQLAQALLCGHILECSMYVTGGNFSGFKSLIDDFDALSFPLAEIQCDGTFMVTKNSAETGIVTVQTVTTQILYEIQGNMYLNPDVQADLRKVTLRQLGKDQVEVTGARGFPPPNTAKVAAFAVGGYQAEAFCFATGLDWKLKFQIFEKMARSWLSKNPKFKFSKLSFQHIGQNIENGRSELEATATMRIFAQAAKEEDFPPNGLAAFVESLSMGTYPGYHRALDLRCTMPKLFMNYWPTRIDENKLRIATTFLGGESIPIPNHGDTVDYMTSDDYDAQQKYDANQWGPTVSAPLGTIVMGRSGDKGANANIGLFVRYDDEYDWLRAYLTKSNFLQILGDEAHHVYKLERVEFPGLLAVHFLCRGLLGTGVCSTDRLDGFAKSMAEYIRARTVELPKKFVDRGAI
jgi:hypothetical protein